MIYGQRTNGGEHGTVLTKREVAEFMLDTLSYDATNNLSSIKILEPAVGEGVFLDAIVERLHRSSQKFNFNFEKSLGNIKAVEIDKEKIESLRDRLKHKLAGYDMKNLSVIGDILVEGDFLFSHFDHFDLIVGNPPYVRYDNIPKDLQRRYRRFFSIFRHRADLYILFFEKGLNLLTQNGQLCYICSNRWMKNQYGQKLRDKISKFYSIPLIINLEDANPFKEKVHAYASIVVITMGVADKIHYFETQNLGDLRAIKEILSGRDGSASSTLKSFLLSKPKDYKWILDPELEGIQGEDYKTLEAQGYKIGIGVATGADSVFIGKELPEKVEEDILLPIISGKDIVDGDIHWQGNYVINPYEPESGRLIKLAKYPRLKSYLEEHKKILVNRHIAKKYPRKWYKTIDKIDVALTNKPKLILPDMKRSPYIALDEGRYYPHHNAYYILNHDKEKLEILGAILMSDFVRKQITAISNKMNGGYPRWQAQNLRKIRIPEIIKLTDQEKEKLIGAFHRKNLQEVDRILNLIIGGASKTEAKANHNQEKPISIPS